MLEDSRDHMACSSLVESMDHSKGHMAMGSKDHKAMGNRESRLKVGSMDRTFSEKVRK
jgi:hypothetical protein